MGVKAWNLGEIREAYREALSIYNELSRPRDRVQVDAIEGDPAKSDEDFCSIIIKKAKESAPKLKEAADQSGDPVVWRRGDPLSGLNKSLRKRIEAGLKFCI